MKDTGVQSLTERFNMSMNNSTTRAEASHTPGQTTAPENHPQWKVSDVMTSRVLAVQPDATLETVADVMNQEDIGFVPVIDTDRHVIGCITDRDLVLRGIATPQQGGVRRARARDVMTKDVRSVQVDEDLEAVLGVMGDLRVRRVPVVDDEQRLVGVVSMSDVAIHAEKDHELQRALERVWNFDV